ncbi:hypothetical protein L218DRAFT_858240 [Marasmius fiardii PR-910]|nr:hypothetical protein L218DRAFT_858240 [Marasmius fiardii PR-910]
MKLLAQAQETIHALSTKQANTDSSVGTTALAEPVAPAFITGPVPEHKSLFNAFPRLEASIILDVTRHDIIPTDIHKLDSKLRRKAIDQGALSALTSRAGSTKDYPSLSALLYPLTIYFQILAHFAASSGHVDVIVCLFSGVLQYIMHLTDLNLRYEWDAVLAYHMAYHAERCHEMKQNIYTGWGKLDEQLSTEFLVGRVKSVKPSSSSTSKAGKKVPIEQQACFAFNAGNCTSKDCKRLHLCSVCQAKDHVKDSCPKKDK